MSEDMSGGKASEMSREERLAAKLRENLRRRKAQARESKSEMRDSEPQDLPNPDSES